MGLEDHSIAKHVKSLTRLSEKRKQRESGEAFATTQNVVLSAF